MWTTERKQVAQELAEHSDDETFEAYVDRKRQEAQETLNTSMLVHRLAEMEEEHGRLTARYQIRRRIHLGHELEELRQLIARRESGEEQKSLEQVLDRYVEAYRAKQNESTTSGSSRSRKRLVSGLFKNKTAAKAAAAAAKGPKLRAAFESAEGSEKRYYLQDSVKHELMAELGHKPPPIYLVQGDMCAKCNVAMIVLASEALLGCPKCSRTRLYIQATSSRIAYGEEVEFANFSYKRQNHFIEWLNTFQAKESTEVPVDIIDQVMQDLVVNKKVKDVSKITQKKVREVMKELKLRKFYDHCAQITKRITGKLPPRMSPFQAEQVKLMFSAIQGPFNMHCPPERTNFLSYGYCLYKFCELLGYDEFLPCFPLLKGKDKLAAMDRIWKKICVELDWQFIPTVADDAMGFKLMY
jgi:hypothetical protein